MRLFMLWWCFGATVLFAQLAPQPPQKAYEGQNVSWISLVANPHRDLAPLFQVVTQKAGSPYSQQKIDESAAALKNAGHFAGVRVQVVPDINGLRVSFLLEPAYYLGVVEFPGAEKRFSYTRLLQTADLSDEDPYDPTRIPIAVDTLRKFMQNNGYFQAKVKAEPHIDDAHQLVEVSFVIDMGKQAKIASVTIEGPDKAETARLLHSIHSLWARLSRGLLKPGKSYTPQRITNATSLMKKTLNKQRRLASSIKENPPQFDASTNRVAISFKVDVGPVVTIRTEGAKLSLIP
ncbi:MAG TPA: POTRA domain-containing protein, partial [Candidatus Sulfotelmatobacter sp.]|nr:POTRA domain-containing protein [Candidatus Sulfotelmatobacter sp.]